MDNVQSNIGLITVIIPSVSIYPTRNFSFRFSYYKFMHISRLRRPFSKNELFFVERLFAPSPSPQVGPNPVSCPWLHTQYNSQLTSASGCLPLEPHPEDARRRGDRRHALKYQTSLRLPELNEWQYPQHCIESVPLNSSLMRLGSECKLCVGKKMALAHFKLIS
jgi:hypothetical protein